ncbi:MAG: hypothetical protein ACWA44_02790 [Thiotrichales bacterium]
MNDLPLAEDMPYWKTSKSGVEGWLDKTEKLIEQIGGQVDTRIVGKSGGREGILFGFFIEGDAFKMMWPVLPTKKPEDRSSATRQCATLIYHDTKARINRVRIFGARVVFSDWLVLDNGKTLAEQGHNALPAAIQNIQLLN